MIKYLFITLALISGEESLRDQYKSASEKVIKEILGTGELREIDIETRREYYEFISGDDKSGSKVIYSSAKGRFEYFDYLIILNTKNEVSFIKILKYRSEYGYEISNKGWLKQFYNKPLRRFEYGKEIDTISGATFSASSLVEDINQILEYLQK